MNQQDQDTIETLIDIYSLSEVIEALSDICMEKAEHVETNWQDHTLAKIWRKDGLRLNKLKTRS